MHIVIISHYYPPLNAIASFRPASFAKFFVENGIDVTVLTTAKTPAEGSLDLPVYKHDRLALVEVPYAPLQFWRKPSAATNSVVTGNDAQVYNQAKVVKALLTKVRKWGVSCLGSLADYQFFWTKPALKAFDLIHKQRPVDIVISTFGPPAAHQIAAAIVGKYPHIPWVADYRDLWSQRHIMTAKGPFRWIESYLERKTIKRASALTTVSKPLEEKLCELVKSKVPVSVIYNGYDTQIDPKRFEERRKIQGSIQIVYTGTIYEGRSDPSPLFQAIGELFVEGVLEEGNIQVKFYGNRMANLNQIIERYNAFQWVELMGAVSHAESLRLQQDADFLLFLESNKPDARGVLTGKLFEYITTGKTILAVGVDEYCASAQVLMETQTGVVFNEDVALIKHYLKQVWMDKQEPMMSARFDMIEQYSRATQSQKMLEVAQSALLHHTHYA